ncbi:hypothetical protein [Eleftheria terrae]|uniref:hypothetical protein n=1 Tax=Eleftheria terrae TaxID=1597781 RepID=UPI00263A4102|nr:hypothetical protein [Eleftheria terrae]WKB52976.1 hypothetical protein N7L95_00815 [Eleftheria terrae]
MPNEYLQHLQGPAGETWQQAVDRFAAFCLSLHEFVEDGEAYEVLFDEYYRDGSLFEWQEPVSEPDLLAMEAKLGWTLPDALKGVFRKRFAIYDVSTRFGRWGDRRVLEFNRSSEYGDCLHPLSKAIAWNFGPYFTDEELSPQQVAHLDANYFGFGRWSDDDHRSTYLLVDRQGGFGRYDFHTEDYVGSVERLGPLLEGRPLTLGLDELLTSAITDAMVHLLKRNDVPLTEPEAGER